MTTELIPVDPRYPGAWQQVQGYLQEALDRGGGNRDWSLEDIYQAAVAGVVTLWVVTREGEIFGAGVTTVARFPRRIAVEIIVFGCNRNTEEDWAKLLPKLKEYAKSIGASSIMGTGREGWVRKLKATHTRTVWDLEV